MPHSPGKHVRPSTAGRVVVTVSAHLHKQGKRTARRCPQCGALWTASYVKATGSIHVWKNSEPADAALLDFVGNNASVECCS